MSSSIPVPWSENINVSDISTPIHALNNWADEGIEEHPQQLNKVSHHSSKNTMLWLFLIGISVLILVLFLIIT